MVFKNQKIIQLFIFMVTASAVCGSLYFSEIMKLPPCSLCWYQRVFIYPIAVFTLSDILRDRLTDMLNIIILSLIGFIISSYHNLLYYGFIENIVPCSQGVSCTSKQIEWFGFITIPFLSWIAFFSLLALSTYCYFIILKKEKAN